jgi:hypothetical protein
MVSLFYVGEKLTKSVLLSILISMKHLPSTSEIITTPQTRDLEQLWQEVF